ncbi:MAG TPA: methyltransferase domain-containing protein [Gemmatimonadaceae bacterium]
MRARREWWETYFNSRYLLEYEPIFSPERDRKEVARLVELLGLAAGSRVLDVPCGHGRHSHLLAEAGFSVDGVDYSESLLNVARRRGTGSGLRYNRHDMRRLPRAWTGRFDAVLNLFTSFGFFADPQDDERVVEEFSRVLGKGGRLIWHGASRDGVMARFLSKDWWVTSDRTFVAQHRSFDPLSGILDVKARHRDKSGREKSRNHRIRLYTATRLAELFAAHAIVVDQAYSGFTRRALNRRSTQMLLVGTRQ